MKSVRRRWPTSERHQLLDLLLATTNVRSQFQRCATRVSPKCGPAFSPLAHSHPVSNTYTHTLSAPFQAPRRTSQQQQQQQQQQMPTYLSSILFFLICEAWQICSASHALYAVIAMDRRRRIRYRPSNAILKANHCWLHVSAFTKHTMSYRVKFIEIQIDHLGVRASFFQRVKKIPGYCRSGFLVNQNVLMSSEMNLNSSQLSKKADSRSDRYDTDWAWTDRHVHRRGNLKYVQRKE